jgi:integrase
MARPASDTPWSHRASGFWCATLDGTRRYLDRDYRAACRKLGVLRREAQRKETNPRDCLDTPFAVLCDEYLDDLKARRKPLTYEGTRYRLRRALTILGTELRVGALRKFHLAQVERALTGSHSPTTVRDTLAAVSGVLQWAVRNDLLETNPVAGYEKPAARSRHRIIKPAEYQAMLRASDAHFRRVLLALRPTGCRPGEVRALVWEWVDLDAGVWIFPEHKSITRQRHLRPRIIPLPDAIWKLCRWLARRPHTPSDIVFVNARGRGYSKDRLVKKMDSIRERAGLAVKAGTKTAHADSAFCSQLMKRAFGVMSCTVSSNSRQFGHLCFGAARQEISNGSGRRCGVIVRGHTPCMIQCRCQDLAVRKSAKGTFRVG